MNRQEADRFLGKEVAIIIGEDDEEFLGVKGRLTKVTDDVIELDNNEDDLCSWKLSEVQAIELLGSDWIQPFAWIGDMK